MRKQFLMAVLLVVSTVFSVNAQKEVSGVKVSNNLVVEGHDLMLNGAGLREKMWIDLYVGSLYLPKKSSNAAEIMSSNDAQAIKLNIVSGMITSEKMINAVNEGFENATGGKTAPLKAKIDKFKSFFKDEIKKGDEFLIANVPGKGVMVSKNGVAKGTIDGADFKKALFGIWLSNKPADKDLKAGMLGK
ncbi:chalcone isomerase family protein [Flavobacterium okayamense]|uniref:Chalcone isomerase n=1 Tax=Flavobacterium okayamense TaxID=2830782 RepID=A0ABM7S7Q6_9FLAO|nr:chalcone isomerase family protein [Flavobacterium okayamense]BCY29515.1 chalcone isomerase [Flavobacterium okayamense]